MSPYAAQRHATLPDRLRRAESLAGMTGTTWTRNDDGTLSCSACATASFKAGASCKCKPGLVAADGPPKPRVKRATPAKRRKMPSTDDYERRLLAIADAERRLRLSIGRVQRENLPGFELGADGKPGKVKFIRAWEADHSVVRLRISVLAEERKTVVQLHAMAIAREMPDLVDRLEALQALQGSAKRGRRSHSLETVQ